MSHHDDRQEDIKQLGELIKEIKIAMLTTVDAQGELHSRPMATLQAEFDGDLWFFTKASSEKSIEIQHAHNVNVSYAAPDDQRYVSVSGKAYIERDREKMKNLWNPIYKAWFPDGLDDPDLILLRIAVESAEYWDSPSNPAVLLAGFAKALVTGKTFDTGKNEAIDLSRDDAE